MNELEETVAKSQTFKSPTERSKISLSGTLPSKKQSEDSLKECDSLFRIIPPTSEKKRNNFEIRDFVTRCQTIAKRESENEKNLKLAKRKSAGKANKKSKESGVQLKSQKSKIGLSQPLPLTHGLQAILDTINDNKKTILQAMAEFQQKDGILEKAETVKESSVEESDAEEESSKVEKREREETQKITFRENDVKAISKIIQSTNAKIHFMWLSIKPAIHLKCFNYSPEIINKFQKTTFCTKVSETRHEVLRYRITRFKLTKRKAERRNR